MKKMIGAALALMLIAALPAGCSKSKKGAEITPPSETLTVASYAEVAKKALERRASRPPDEDTALMEKAAADLKAEMPSPGLKVGQKAPDFTLTNAEGRKVRLYDELKKGPVVLVFYRGAWCPYCNMHLRVLRESLPAFRALGAHLVAVTPQKPDATKKQFEKEGYPFEILSDLSDSVMETYKLKFEVPAELRDVYTKFGINLEEYNGPGRYALPVPGTFVIDREGMIRAAFADTDYTKRMEPADIAAALAEILHSSRQ